MTNTTHTPEECEVSINHALVHLRSALENRDGPEQLKHDLLTAIAILQVLLEDQ